MPTNHIARSVAQQQTQYARKMRRIRNSVLITTSALVLPGCGGSTPKGPRLTREEFVTRMHSICRSGHTMRGQFGDPAFDKRLIDEAHRELSQLRKLNPPRADEDALRDAFDHWSSALDAFERLTRAAENKDREAGEKAFRDAASDVNAIARLIPEYPAGECLGEGL